MEQVQHFVVEHLQLLLPLLELQQLVVPEKGDEVELNKNVNFLDVSCFL